MSKKLVVGPDLTPDWLRKRRKIMGEIDDQLIRGLEELGKGLTLDQLQLVVEHRDPFEVMETFTEALFSHTANLLFRRFCTRVDEVDPLPPEFTEENLARWSQFNLKPVFLPDEEIGENRRLKGWTKPEKWFYKKIREGKIAAGSTTLKRGWYLADFMLGVDYSDGSQVFQDDPFAPIIQRLREAGQIGQHDNTPLGSRFSVTNDEWRTIVCPAIAEHLGFQTDQVRLERAIEFNAIGNLYDPNRGKFNMWEWWSDAFEGSKRLLGGDRGNGGLANVSYNAAGYRFDDIAARPLVSFVR